MGDFDMRIVITGATGYIGRYVTESISNANDVFAIVRETSDIKIIEKYVNEIIIYKENKIYDDMRRIKPDLLIHLAGVFYSDHSSDTIKNLLESNIVFGAILLDSVVSSGCKGIINTASYWQNYGGNVYNPVNLYAATKQSMEDIIIYYVQAKRCKAITLQIFDSYGPCDNRRKILNIIRDMKEGEQIDMSEGNQKLYYCHIQDLVNAYVLAIQMLNDMPDRQYQKYALRGEHPVTLKKIIQTYLDISKKDIHINWGKYDYREREIVDPYGIGEVLPGWRPQITLENGLKTL